MRRRTGVMAVVLLALTASAAAQTRGITGRPAPGFGVAEWRNLPEGRTNLDIAAYEGRVLYLFCFQSWCPGCHAHGFPTLKKLVELYDGADDVAFVTVQTVFEGYSTNTPQAAWRTAERYGLDIPVGHDGRQGRRSQLMRRYRTGGTPWTIIVDKDGVVRFDGFRIDVDRARKLIDELRVDAPPRVATLPESRGRQHLVGKRLPKLEFDAEIDRPMPERLGAKPAPATLYRWWTDGCAYCKASLPGIERLRERYQRDGLRVVAVYHPKPPARVNDASSIRRIGAGLGYRGELAVDADWSELKRLLGADDDGRATSVSVLVDGAGVIRFVHPGPVLFPSEDPAHRRENADFQALEQAVRTLVSGDSGRSPDRLPSS